MLPPFRYWEVNSGYQRARITAQKPPRIYGKHSGSEINLAVAQSWLSRLNVCTSLDLYRVDSRLPC